MAKPGPKPKDLPTYVSLGACATALKIPKGFLSDAKRAGCSAFRANGTVNLADFIQWLCTDNPGEEADGMKWSEKLARVKTKREEMRLAQDEGKTIERGIVQDALTNGMAVFRGEVERILCTELPPALKGLSELEIQRRCVAEITRLMDALREKLALLTDAKEENKVEETK